MSNITDGDIKDAINRSSELHKDNLFTGEIAWDICVHDMGTELLELRKEVETLRNALDNDIRDKKQNMHEELQKENAELRECLKQLVQAVINCIPNELSLDEIDAIEKAKAALEGWNHAND